MSTPPSGTSPQQGQEPRWAIVLAAGSGVRFDAPKQFADIAGTRPVDLAVNSAVTACDHTVLVLPPATRWTGPPVDHIVAGGANRAASVRAGLSRIPDASGVVVVHQAANPLASVETLAALIDAVEGGAHAAAPGLRPPDLVRRIDGGVAGEVLGRDDLVLIQTPAAFRLEVLREAHTLDILAFEDTERVTAAGYEVQILPGDPANIHVVRPEDLVLVEALLAARQR